MPYRYAVLGSGMQGTAAGYDLARCGEASLVTFIDRERSLAERAADRVNRLIGRPVARGLQGDGGDPRALETLVAGHEGVFSALPFAMNPAAARAAIKVRASFCDLGGNTAIVRETLALDALAREAGVSVVPDTGLAPGLGNQLAALGIARLRRPQHVHIRCGGLPRHPRPPLEYKLVFNIGGLTNEYTGESECLREGRIVRVPTLSELEDQDFPPPIGRLEAFTTSGGTSTCCESFAGRLQTYDYKTLRYPGHCAHFRVIRDLGLLETSPIKVRDALVVPREVFHACAAPRLDFPADRDLVVLRVTCEGDEHRERVMFDLLDFHDENTGFTAMERATAFPAAATLHFQVSGRIAPGAHPTEGCVPGEDFLAAVRARGLAIVERA